MSIIRQAVGFLVKNESLFSFKLELQNNFFFIGFSVGGRDYGVGVDGIVITMDFQETETVWLSCRSLNLFFLLSVHIFLVGSSIFLVCLQGCFSFGARHVRAIFQDAKEKVSLCIVELK
ncbi:hypothetical protein MKW92_027084 [Papaver armeniacum]|nr:hypothetical protein MKW92_027084 [Papaver armeniacum]